MSDFNLSYSLGSPPAATAAQGPLFSFNSVKVLPCVGNTVTLHHVKTQQGMLVQAEVAHALSFCKTFRTMEAHLNTVLAAMPPLQENPEDARNILTGIRDAGFLESSEDAWARLTRGTDPREIPPARLFILTCDRPAALERLLNNLADVGVDPAIESVWVIDDSKRASSTKNNAEIIATCANRLPVPVRHVDRAMQQRLMEHLIEALPQHAPSVAFLLDGETWPNTPTYGRARNLALLLSVGHRALVLDDDILLQAIAPPYTQRELKLGSPNERESVMYAGQDELGSHALPIGGNPLALMLNNVGTTVGEVVASQLSGPLALVGWDGEMLSHHSASSRILLNQCGSWGDPGTGDGSWIFFLPPSSIKTALAAETPLESLLAARASWLGYRGPTLSPYGTISQFTGIDHTALLPPYFPAERGEDILFGVMLQRVHPESLVFSEGWSIRHEPMEPRSDRGHLNPMEVSPSLLSLADWLGQEPEDQWGLTPERRLHNLSSEVKALSEMDERALEQLVGAQLASKRTSLLARCMGHSEQLATLDNLPNSGAWGEFLSATQSALIEALQIPDATPISKALASAGQTDWASLRNIGNNLADSLTAWPEICAAAKTFEA